MAGALSPRMPIGPRGSFDPSRQEGDGLRENVVKIIACCDDFQAALLLTKCSRRGGYAEICGRYQEPVLSGIGILLDQLKLRALLTKALE